MNKNLDKNTIAQILRKELPYLREQYGVEKIALYGSFVLRQMHTNVPWRLLAGVRDKMIHHYFGVNYETVRTIASK